MTVWQPRFGAVVQFFLSPFLGLNKEPVMYRGAAFHLVYFGLFAAIACFFGVLLSAYYLQLKGVQLGNQVWLLYISIVCAIWLSARSGHFIALGRKFFEAPEKFLRETRFYVQAAIFGLIPTAMILGYAFQIPTALLLDSLAYGGLFALFIGRIGCYNYGCCFGVPSSVSWATAYCNDRSKVVRQHPELKGVKLHPAQLYTAFLNLLAFIVVTLWIPFLPRDGAISVFFVLYHGSARLFLNRLRYVGLFEHRKASRLPNIPLLTILAGLGLLCVGPYVSPTFLSASPIAFHSFPTWVGFFSWVLADPSVLLVALVCSCLLFLGYGVHGEALGTFVSLSKDGG